MGYDSRIDTLLHIKRVSQLLNCFAKELIERGDVHDDSKLVSPEKELFDELTPLLSSLRYGTPEYQESLDRLKPALDHHYANNSHHPQHYVNGIDGMDLLDLVEMFFDWKAATERTKDGDIRKSIEINSPRFNLSPQLISIFNNTITNYNW
jgi:Family of unknown function (DUF5662)